jgi:hypothetical protein
VKKGLFADYSLEAMLSGMVDRIPSVLYDRVTIKAGDTPPEGFVAYRLAFLVQGLSRFPPAIPECSWEFYIDQKWFARGPLALDVGWGNLKLKDGWNGYQKQGDQIGDGAEVNPEAVEDARVAGPRIIRSLQRFGVRLHFGRRVPANTDVDFWCVLVGQEDRAVQ